MIPRGGRNRVAGVCFATTGFQIRIRRPTGATHLCADKGVLVDGGEQGRAESMGGRREWNPVHNILGAEVDLEEVRDCIVGEVSDISEVRVNDRVPRR